MSVLGGSALEVCTHGLMGDIMVSLIQNRFIPDSRVHASKALSRKSGSWHLPLFFADPTQISPVVFIIQR